jgi:hypothetical protein
VNRKERKFRQQPDYPMWVLATLRLFLDEKLDNPPEFERMSSMDTENTSQTAPRIPMFSEQWGERKAIFYETFSSVKDLAERGVQLYQVSAADFFRPVIDSIKQGKPEVLSEVFDGAAIVCQLGLDRSKKLKLLALGLGANPATTSEDVVLMNQRHDGLEVGMSWEAFGKLIAEGSVDEQGHLLPRGYDQPVRKIIGFLDKAGVRDMREVDLNDVNMMSKRLVSLLNKNSIEDLDLEVTIIEGTSAVVDEFIDRALTEQSRANSTNQ